MKNDGWSAGCCVRSCNFSCCIFFSRAWYGVGQFFKKLWNAISTKPESMKTRTYRKQEIYIDKETMTVVKQKSVYSDKSFALAN